jgi:hypothetical protein
MPKKSDLKAVGVVTVGVMLAGFLMFQLREIRTVQQASAGFGA